MASQHHVASAAVAALDQSEASVPAGTLEQHPGFVVADVVAFAIMKRLLLLLLLWLALTAKLLLLLCHTNTLGFQFNYCTFLCCLSLLLHLFFEDFFLFFEQLFLLLLHPLLLIPILRPLIGILVPFLLSMQFPVSNLLHMFCLLCINI